MTDQSTPGMEGADYREIKLEKLKRLQERDRDPFNTVRYDRSHCAAGIIARFAEVEDKEVAIGGRIVSKRLHGKAGFADLMDGSHVIDRCEEVTTEALEAVFAELYAAGVKFEGMLLKPNMILAGKDCPEQASVQEVAEATIRVLKRTVPPAVPGIVFLSGGQTPAQATENLSAMNAIGGFPWQLSFSYGRALQEETLKTWLGKEENYGAGQKMFYRRAKLNSLARFGEYSPELESASA